MRNPAKFTVGLELFSRENKRAHSFGFGIKGGFGSYIFGNMFHFFCNFNRRFTRGYGDSLALSSFLWFVGSAKVLMIASKRCISGLRGV